MRSSRTKVKTYYEETSSDESSGVPRSEGASLSLRSRSTTRMPRTYREESTDASFDQPVEAQDSEQLGAAPREEQSPTSESAPTTRPPRQPRPRRTANPKPKQNKRPSRGSGQVGRPLRKRAKTYQDDGIILGSGIIPPWQTLPYHVLFDIFLRASYPLLDEGRSDRNDSVKWLVNVALLCRSFQEPALAALLHCPPLLPAHKTHALLSLLSQPSDSLSMNYASKIKKLHVEVEPLLLLKSGPTLGYFDLTKLIEKTPQVHTVRLYHKDDYTVGIPPWHITQSRWIYPDALFPAINNSGVILRSWDWNGRFLETDVLLEVMALHHQGPAFAGLRELKLLHLNDSQLDEFSDEGGGSLIDALKHLPELQRLEFLESSMVSGQVLTNLPHTIRSLTLRNCDRMWSTDLTAFLNSHGTNLQELSLSHNRHLSMSFVQNLGQSCPNLEIFKMDLSMHDGSSYHDVEPHFEYLLVQTETPTWPVKLQEIELIQLRKWDDATAEVFFNSLVNAAPDLRKLRKLGISAILKIGWRDRATFRERWISRLEKVFLRRSLPPNPNLRSIRKRQLKPSHLAAENGAPSEAYSDESRFGTANSGPSTTKRQSTRLAQQSSVEADDSATNSLRGSSPSDAGKIQGMCDIVNIRIDNQRPTEMQYNENDFLDDELSGDEDWDGDDFEPAPGHAW
jgi:hypothetical protein